MRQLGTIEWLVARRRYRLVRELLLLCGLEVHAATSIGQRVTIHHRGIGTVIHPETTIGDDVTIFHQVTIGRADAHRPRHLSPMKRIEIGDQAVLYPGARVLGGVGVTRVGEGTIVAANAVVTQSTGDWEIWGGVPAKKIGERARS
ncbi:hypothetical protein EEJ31_07130 [Cryobacterium tepidiphilum]|uniref:Serine acetyltransferase n=1 Tax=Cryobacterium tepidiphilum TaxID=2486026 RepID=A0A3M8LCE4_9MICO|nr:hypothetical protein EEJ31_07130 [Cryobacterium tepidiphilum]